jgi:hypothetical protein
VVYIFHRNYRKESAKLVCVSKRVTHWLLNLAVVVLDRGEASFSESLKLFKGLIRIQDEIHDVRAVELGVPIHHIFPDVVMLEGVEIPAVELSEAMFELLEAVLYDLVNSPVIPVQAGFELGVDGLHFALQRVLIEQRRDKELREAVHCLVEPFFINLKVVIRVSAPSAGVRAAGVLLEKLSVFLLVGVLFRPHEQHVLQKMREPFSVPRGLEPADVHINSRAGDVAVFIRDEEAGHLVWKL